MPSGVSICAMHKDSCWCHIISRQRAIDDIQNNTGTAIQLQLVIPIQMASIHAPEVVWRRMLRQDLLLGQDCHECWHLATAVFNTLEPKYVTRLERSMEPASAL